MEKMDVKEFLRLYIEQVIDKDLKKLEEIAQESEKLEEEQSHLFSVLAPDPNIPEYSDSQAPTIETTTLQPNSQNSPLRSKEPQSPTRLTIPMAMILLATVDRLGSFLDPSNNKLDQNIESFFAYSGYPLDEDQKKILKTVFRNAMMHGFFPEGDRIGISYDSGLRDRQLFFWQGGILSLNVTLLARIVSDTARKMYNEVSTNDTIQQSFDRWYAKSLIKTKDLISKEIEKNTDEKSAQC